MSQQLQCISGLQPLPTTIEQNIMSTFVPIFLISRCQVLLIIKIGFYLENATKNILSTKASLYWKVYKFNKSNSAA